MTYNVFGGTLNLAPSIKTYVCITVTVAPSNVTETLMRSFGHLWWS